MLTGSPWRGSVEVDVNNESEMTKIVRSCLGTKFMRRWMDLAC